MSYHGGCLRFPTAYTVLAYLGCASIDADAVRVVYVARGDSRMCCHVVMSCVLPVFVFPILPHFEAEILRHPGSVPLYVHFILVCIHF